MPRVFVYEHITATGLGRAPASPEHSLFVEGNAMLSAITADFAAVPGVDLLHFPDGGSPDDFTCLAASADWTLVIAPETGGELERFARAVIAAGGRLLGPSPEAISLTSDKLWLGEVWERLWVRNVCERRAVPTPYTFAEGEPLFFPLVCKPRDGCGSEATYMVRTTEELAALPVDPDRLMQEFVPGQPASIAFLIGPKQTIPLLPTFQHISTDGRFCYLGGELPIPLDLAERAVALGRQAVEAIAGLSGYVGVDLVLGDRDVAIEINPRLTTSYVGLRALAETNLAGAMLDVCAGKPVNLKWKAGKVTFTADGTVKGQPA
jgi:predicted ATP-grasp superfamily ATP-dependent carboligase